MLPSMYDPKGQNEASYNSEMPKNQSFPLKTNIQNDRYFGGLAVDLQYRAPEMGFPSCEINKENFRDSQGKQI